MPTENEAKVITVPSHRFEEEVIRAAPVHLVIEQGYLTTQETTVRLRKSYNRQAGATSHFLTVKRTVRGRTIEIETEIDERDYRDLWRGAKCRVCKNRYVLDGWEFDFFYAPKHGLYFAMAEFEMPEGQAAPEAIHPLVRRHLLYEVPPGDKRFTSRKLGKVRYAQALVRKLGLPPGRLPRAA